MESSSPSPFQGTPRYRLLQPLGTGGMGSVYGVLDGQSGQKVALKLAHDANARGVLRFKREFRLLAGLDHPNLVQLYELGHYDDRLFYTMEWVQGQDPLIYLLGPGHRAYGQGHEAQGTHTEGQSSAVDASTGLFVAGERTLSMADDFFPSLSAKNPAHRNASLPLPPMACQRSALDALLHQLVDALVFLHKNQIIHRDLKPSNILIDAQGMLKLLDFGLASQAQVSWRLSQTGAMMGTVYYMAPEQFLGEVATEKADYYALGCLLFQFITGTLPHHGTPMQIMDARLHKPPPSPAERARDLDPALVDLCLALLSREPAERPDAQSIGDILGHRPTLRGPSIALNPGKLTTRIGRDSEMAQLQAALELAHAGEMQRVFISGDSGVGKSFLTGDVIQLAKSKAFTCLSGRCYRRERLPFAAFDALMDALTLMLLRWPVEERRILTPILRRLERIFPVVRALLEGDIPSEGGVKTRRELSHQAFEAFSELIAFCQKKGPILLVLDDLHWADKESLALLQAFLRENRGRILILCLYRPGLLPDTAAPSQISDFMARFEGIHLHLEAFKRDEVSELVAQADLKMAPDFLVDRIMEGTQGNPFFAQQTLHYIQALEVPAQAAFQWGDSGADGIVKALLQAHSPEARRILNLAAVAGGAIRAKQLMALSELERVQFERAIRTLIDAKILVRRESIGGHEDQVGAVGVYEDVFDFAHDPIREGIYDALDLETRQAWHRRIAKYLEGELSTQQGDVDALFRHWAAAGEEGRHRQLALQAAHEAAQKLALSRASLLFFEALAIPDPHEPALKTAELWEYAGDLSEESGRFEAAAQAFEAALSFYAQAGLDEKAMRTKALKLWGRIGEDLIYAGHFQAGRGACAKALAQMQVKIPHSTMGQIFAILKLKIRSTAYAILPEAWRQRRSHAWDESRAESLSQLIRALAIWPLWAFNLVEHFSLLDLRIRSPRIQFTGLFHRMVFYGMAGALHKSGRRQLAETLRQSEGLLSQNEIPLGREIILLFYGGIWMPTDAKRSQQAVQSVLEALEERGVAGGYYWSMGISLQLILLWQRGDYAALLRLSDDVLRGQGMHVIASGFAALLKVRTLVLRGQLVEATQVIAQIKGRISPGPLSIFDHFMMAAEMALMVADNQSARAYDWALKYEKQAFLKGIPVKGMIQLWWLESALAAAIELAQTQRLDMWGRWRARRWIHILKAVDFGGARAMGFLAESRLSSARGDRAAALNAIYEALDLSAHHMDPYGRYSCLTEAEKLGALPLSLEKEWVELGAEFAQPQGGGYANPLQPINDD